MFSPKIEEHRVFKRYKLRFDLRSARDYYRRVNLKSLSAQGVLGLVVVLLAANLSRAETFRVAAYNVENYLDQPGGTRPLKSDAAKAKIRETIHALKADVVSFEEMGSLSAFHELRTSLKAEGLDFPHWEHVTSYDTNIHVAVLSKFPIVARRPHTNDNFLLSGRRFRVSRGFTEVDIKVNDHYTFTLIGAHLKSKRPVPQADEAEMRLEEAKVLRAKIESRLAANPRANLIVLGDLNDTYNTKTIKEIVGRGRNALVDTRPAERNGDNLPNPTNPRYNPRNVAWTHYYGVEDTYSRIDYILISQGMAREWMANETYVLTIPNWGLGSDHRPIVATFEARESQ